MWDGYDTLGIISCIAGVVLLVIPVPIAFAGLVWLIGGIGVLVMGIIAVSNSSKIGIGGIIIGAIVMLIGIFFI